MQALVIFMVVTTFLIFLAATVLPLFTKSRKPSELEKQVWKVVKSLTDEEW